MINIAIPGVFPGVIALLLALTAVRAHFSYKKWDNKRYKTSKYLCIVGACMFFLLAIFQLLEVVGVSFR